MQRKHSIVSHIRSAISKFFYRNFSILFNVGEEGSVNIIPNRNINANLEIVLSLN